MEAVIGVEAAKPECVLEYRVFAATCRHFPDGTLAERRIEEIRVAGTITDDGGVDIVDIAARERWLLAR